jgi:D-methionine transport system substrate-binding protein
MKKVISILTAAILVITIAVSCSSKSSKSGAETSSKGTLTFGFSPGPYSDLFKLAIKPGLEKKGYKIKTVEFTDWVTPNLALGNKEIDANIFQHSRYLAQFSKDKGLVLSPVIAIPTASLGLYSRKLNARSIDELKNELSPGKTITIPHDPTNLARALIFLQNLGLITIKKDIDPTKASEKDILENSYRLVFTPVDAAQLPRTLESADLAVISGNYAISAGIRLSTAIAGERLELETENIVAVRTEDLEKPFVADLKEIIRSEEFKQVTENPQYDFASFQRPQWYVEQWKIGNR